VLLMDFDHPPTNPLDAFQSWFDEASKLDVPNPNAMTLATVDPDGRPSARIVLLKGIDERGAVFYTNKNARKGRALAANPRAALVFFWDELGKQVRIEGVVSEVTDEESDAYFVSRPRMSQIGAWASRQSEPAANRAELDAAVEEVEKRFANQDVPRPPYWGGYRVTLETIEFWQGHPFRLHDRVVYMRNADGNWQCQRLFP
jgi:pyridoxamine 5'-phosphate oxidase